MLAFKKACEGCRQASCIQNQYFHVLAANFSQTSIDLPSFFFMNCSTGFGSAVELNY